MPRHRRHRSGPLPDEWEQASPASGRRCREQARGRRVPRRSSPGGKRRILRRRSRRPGCGPRAKHHLPPLAELFSQGAEFCRCFEKTFASLVRTHLSNSLDSDQAGFERRRVMDLMRFDPPLRGLERLSESLNRLFTTPFDRTPIEQSLTVAEWSPAVDIEETDKEYLVKVEIPEVKKEDVKVLVEEGTLTIRGERRHEEKVSAEFTDGMLKVHLLKSENAKPRTVEIKVN